MHGISVHSALAIKRQRKRRDEQRRAKERRYSGDHLSPRRLSVTSFDPDYGRNAHVANKVMGTITMFHVGAIFLIIGLFLLTGALVPNETKKEMGDLIGTGVVCIIIGIFLIILNRIYGQKEEEELTNYVESKLARTKSGQRLYRDAESYPEKLDATANGHASVKKKKGKKQEDKFDTLNEVNNTGGGKVNKGACNNDLDDISPAGVALGLERITEESSEADMKSNSINDEARMSDLYRVYDREFVRAGV